jgi:hypothetical protein
MTKRIVNVCQMLNPRYDPENTSDHPKFTYQVESLKNMISPSCGQFLTPKEVEDLIDSGVEVNVKTEK